jgi:hypothetical protein
MAGRGFEVRRLSGSIGAEILSIDLASETDGGQASPMNLAGASVNSTCENR